MRLAYFSPVPWASFRQRPHEFADWFQHTLGGPVLWIEPYPVRLARLGDLRRPHVDVAAAEVLPPWLEVLAPKALPLEPTAAGRWLNRNLFWPHVMERVRAFTAGHEAMIAIGKPSDLALHALGELRSTPSLYDAMDDFAAFHTGASQETARATEAAILQRAGFRMTSSTHLLRRWEAQGLSGVLIPNGVAAARLPAPAEPAPDAPFGYIGTIAAWFDWAWIEELAASWPQRRVEIHGPVFQAPPRALPANVVLGPPMPHAQALERMRGFAAGLIPFLRTPLTESVDPVKYYEYRALGLPVISAAFGDMLQKADEPHVVLTNHPAAEQQSIAGLLGSRDTAESVAGFRQRHDWNARFAPLADLLQPNR